VIIFEDRRKIRALISAGKLEKDGIFAGRI